MPPPIGANLGPQKWQGKRIFVTSSIFQQIINQKLHTFKQRSAIEFLNLDFQQHIQSPIKQINNKILKTIRNLNDFKILYKWHKNKVNYAFFCILKRIVKFSVQKVGNNIFCHKSIKVSWWLNNYETNQKSLKCSTNWHQAQLWSLISS